MTLSGRILTIKPNGHIHKMGDLRQLVVEHAADAAPRENLSGRGRNSSSSLQNSRGSDIQR